MFKWIWSNCPKHVRKTILCWYLVGGACWLSRASVGRLVRNVLSPLAQFLLLFFLSYCWDLFARYWQIIPRTFIRVGSIPQFCRFHTDDTGYTWVFSTDYIHIFPSSVPRNRSVLVWGFGNAAHETAREMQKFTQDRCGRVSPYGSTDWWENFGGTPILNGKIDNVFNPG